MKTLIQGGFVVGFDGTEHEILKDGVVVFDGGRIEFVGKEYSQREFDRGFQSLLDTIRERPDALRADLAK